MCFYRTHAQESCLSLRRLCGLDSTGHAPSEAALSRTLAVSAESQLVSVMYETAVKENCKDKPVGHAANPDKIIDFFLFFPVAQSKH